MKNPEAWRQNARLKLEQLSIEAGAHHGQMRSALETVNGALDRHRDAEQRVRHLERQNMLTGGRYTAELEDARDQLEDSKTVHELLHQRHIGMIHSPSPAGNLYHKADSIARALEITK